jgi:hypothetical protein
MSSVIKKTLPLALFLICLPTHAEDTLVSLLAPLAEGEQQHVLNNLQQDYVDCSAYFLITTGALQKQEENELANDYQQSMMLSMSRASELGSLIDMSEAATSARLEMAIGTMRGKIDDNFNNMSILLRDHRETCKQVMDKPVVRVKNWISELGYN